jgi:hypothetical protein
VSGEPTHYRPWRWVRHIFPRTLAAREVNPEEWERTPCERCDGTGRLLQSRAARDFTPTGSFRNLVYPECRGRGWRQVRRPDERPVERYPSGRQAEPPAKERPLGEQPQPTRVESKPEEELSAYGMIPPTAPTAPSPLSLLDRTSLDE